MVKEQKLVKFSVVNSNAAGIDVGSRSHWVSIGLEEGQTREFGVFTEDLHQLCKWLQSKQIKTVAMESTGYYWKQLFVMLQSYGMEVYLVNASFTKNVKGRKPSDKADGAWIWRLHSAGLLPASFQPDYFTEELRTYTRHRKRLIEGASQCVNRMQKCLTLMNIQLPVVLSDITGKSGTAIVEAILKGERDAKKLAALTDKRVKADTTTIEKALTGFWRNDHLFELKQHWQMYHNYREQISQCDEQIDVLLQNRVKQTGQHDLVYDPGKKKEDKKTHRPST
jgi:transposase